MPKSQFLFYPVVSAAVLLVASAGVAEARKSRATFKTGPSIETARIEATDPKPGEIYVSLADRRLYRVIWNDFAYSFPIGAPRPAAEWEGRMPVSRMKKHPGWAPTPRMLRNDPRLPRYIRGGSRKNPLGTRAIYLGDSMYRVHGTNLPRSIGRSASSGCIRMLNAHVEQLFAMTRVGVDVIVTQKSLRRTDVATASTTAEPQSLTAMLGGLLGRLRATQGASNQTVIKVSDPIR